MAFRRAAQHVMRLQGVRKFSQGQNIETSLEWQKKKLQMELEAQAQRHQQELANNLKMKEAEWDGRECIAAIVGLTTAWLGLLSLPGLVSQKSR